MSLLENTELVSRLVEPAGADASEVLPLAEAAGLNQIALGTALKDKAADQLLVKEFEICR